LTFVGLLFSLFRIKIGFVQLPQDETILVKGLAQNDRKAIEQVYKSEFPVIQSLINNNNGSYDDAQDIFQESLLVLYEKLQDPEFVLNCRIRTYLYSVARRLWLKRLQQMQRYFSDAELKEELVQVEDDLEFHDRKQESFRIMEDAMQHLGEPCRSLLKAYYMEKQTMQHIAEQFGYTNADNAKNQKYKCLTRLKKIFFSHYKKEV